MRNLVRNLRLGAGGLVIVLLGCSGAEEDESGAALGSEVESSHRPPARVEHGRRPVPPPHEHGSRDCQAGAGGRGGGGGSGGLASGGVGAGSSGTAGGPTCTFEYLGDWVRCENAGWPNVEQDLAATNLAECEADCLARSDCTAVDDYYWLGAPELGCWLYTSTCDSPSSPVWAEEDGAKEYVKRCR